MPGEFFHLDEPYVLFIIILQAPSILKYLIISSIGSVYIATWYQAIKGKMHTKLSLWNQD
jgi:hypothetical protein